MPVEHPVISTALEVWGCVAICHLILSDVRSRDTAPFRDSLCWGKRMLGHGQLARVALGLLAIVLVAVPATALAATNVISRIAGTGAAGFGGDGGPAGAAVLGTPYDVAFQADG